jgi:hypothetical protein
MSGDTNWADQVPQDQFPMNDDSPNKASCFNYRSS